MGLAGQTKVRLYSHVWTETRCDQSYIASQYGGVLSDSDRGVATIEAIEASASCKSTCLSVLTTLD